MLLKISQYLLGVTLSNLLHIFFDSYSANTQNINVTNDLKNKRNHTKAHYFLIPQHMQFTTHYFDFESKKVVREQVQIKRKSTDNES